MLKARQAPTGLRVPRIRTQRARLTPNPSWNSLTLNPKPSHPMTVKIGLVHGTLRERPSSGESADISDQGLLVGSRGSGSRDLVY